ncbi:MAG: hypothetical protein JRI86_09620 [Deltaproteobacteria bacterium]|nr:hypothetical protein [Deltaproteobacteria bacterium]
MFIRSLTKQAKQKIWDRFREISRWPLDEKGYVKTPEQNLLDDISLDGFRADLEQGDGNEFYKKFCAVHSSSALAVNCFDFWKSRLYQFSMLGRTRFNLLQFE